MDKFHNNTIDDNLRRALGMIDILADFITNSIRIIFIVIVINIYMRITKSKR